MTDDQKRVQKQLQDRRKGTILRSVISIVTLVIFLLIVLLCLKYCGPSNVPTTSSFDDQTKNKANNVTEVIKAKCQTFIGDKKLNTISYLDYYEESNYLTVGFTFDSGDTNNVGTVSFNFSGLTKEGYNAFDYMYEKGLGSVEGYAYYYEEDKNPTNVHLPSQVDEYITAYSYTLDPKLHKSINYKYGDDGYTVGMLKLVKGSEVKFISYNTCSNEELMGDFINEAPSGSLYAAVIDCLLA